MLYPDTHVTKEYLGAQAEMNPLSRCEIDEIYLGTNNRYSKVAE